jgi:hypothetical protein
LIYFDLICEIRPASRVTSVDIVVKFALRRGPRLSILGIESALHRGPRLSLCFF